MWSINVLPFTFLFRKATLFAMWLCLNLDCFEIIGLGPNGLDLSYFGFTWTLAITVGLQELLLFGLSCFLTLADAESLSQLEFLRFLSMLFSELCYFYDFWSMFLWSVVLGMWFPPLRCHICGAENKLL